ncbi:AbrB family transcriptional regulator [Yoonia maritima]|uniref:AbrB family transcriptional regulator n=1 Tax=Yoonia maritima TaxID=1435347 RepID=UPI000D0F10C8|nr:AbrB family transcriptional regulator [Yoonia maritima]
MPLTNRRVAGLSTQMLALLIGTICGVGAYSVGLPLPWMLGPMMGNTVAAMCHLPVRAPTRLRPIVIPVIGVLLGSGVTAEVFGLLHSWVLTLLLLPVFLACASAVSFTVYRRLGGYDTVTAFYAAMPGGINEMLMLGAEAGGDERRIALAHAARILVVIVFVALFFGLVLGVTSGSRSASNWVHLDALTWVDYAILGFCAVAGTWFGNQIKLPAAPVFGPMILSGAAHIIGWVSVAPPTLLIIIAQITIGTIIGTRFAGASLAQVGRDLALAALASGAMLVVAVIFALLIAWPNGLPTSQAFLAYSPGGLTEMSLLALALEQDVTYVSVMHIFRITLVIAIAPIVFTRWRKG